MIDVTIQKFGRSLLSMTLGVMKYQATMKEQAIAGLQKEVKKIGELKGQADLLEDITFELTSDIIDKRFTTSKQFLETGIAPKQFDFKKSTSKNQRQLQQLRQNQTLRAKTRLNQSISIYNQKVLTSKIITSYETIKER